MIWLGRVLFEQDTHLLDGYLHRLGDVLRERNTLRGDWLALGPYRSRCTYLMRA